MSQVLLDRMPWPEAEKSIKEARAVIVPIGSTEQHGYHMALSVDTVVCRYVSRTLAERTGCVVMPALPYGYAWSMAGYPATVSLRWETYVAVVKDIVLSLRRQGARHVILFSGHNGNVAPNKLVMRELLDEYGFQNVWSMSYTDIKRCGKDILKSELWNGKTFHASEVETSIMLAIAPALVDMTKAVCEYPEIPDDFELRATSWHKVGCSGVYGDATIATAEAGHKFLTNWIGELEAMILTILQ